jgi:hypothetical protein
MTFDYPFDLSPAQVQANGRAWVVDGRLPALRTPSGDFDSVSTVSAEMLARGQEAVLVVRITHREVAVTRILARVIVDGLEIGSGWLRVSADRRLVAFIGFRVDGPVPATLEVTIYDVQGRPGHPVGTVLLTYPFLISPGHAQSVGGARAVYRELPRVETPGRELINGARLSSGVVARGNEAVLILHLAQKPPD